MRIAVCFSGQVRTGVENYQNIREVLGELYDSCDFFIHTWNFCSYKTYNLSNIAKKPVTEPSEKFEAIRQLYSPKKMVVDGKHIGYQTTEEYGIQALWHSFWKSVELKKQYELENNFKYDYVLKLRMDLILNRHTSFELLQEILTIENNQFKTNQWFSPDPIIFKNVPLSTDVFFISKSKEMDIAADYVWALMKSFSNGEYINLIYYLSQQNIKTSQFSYVDRYSLLRDDFVNRGVLELNKSEMLDEIDKLETYYYASPELTNGNNFIKDLHIKLKKNKIKLGDDRIYYLEDIFKLIEESN
jgi:hypothetical protein